MPPRDSSHLCSHIYSPTYLSIPPSTLPPYIYPSNIYPPYIYPSIQQLFIENLLCAKFYTFGEYNIEQNVSAPLELTLRQVAHVACLSLVPGTRPGL